MRTIPALAILLCLATPASAVNLYIGVPNLPRGVPDFCANDGSATFVNNGATLNISGTVAYTSLCVHGTVNIAAGMPTSHLSNTDSYDCIISSTAD